MFDRVDLKYVKDSLQINSGVVENFPHLVFQGQGGGGGHNGQRQAHPWMSPSQGPI